MNFWKSLIFISPAMTYESLLQEKSQDSKKEKQCCVNTVMLNYF